MKIFLSLKAPSGDDDRRAASLALAQAVESAGHTPLAAWQEIERRGLSPQEFMPFVREALRACNLLLVVNHPELRGGLIELGIAYAYGIPIWLAHRPTERVSSSALGCASRVLIYQSLDDLKRQLSQILSEQESR
jgi:hypothetical protein